LRGPSAQPIAASYSARVSFPSLLVSAFAKSSVFTVDASEGFSCSDLQRSGGAASRWNPSPAASPW
jgi:hypothetical protein